MQYYSAKERKPNPNCGAAASISFSARIRESAGREVFPRDKIVDSWIYLNDEGVVVIYRLERSVDSSDGPNDVVLSRPWSNELFLELILFRSPLGE